MQQSLLYKIQLLDQRLGADEHVAQTQDLERITIYNQRSVKPDQAERQRIGPALTYHDRSVY